jgi:hypothetical protein
MVRSPIRNLSWQVVFLILASVVSIYVGLTLDDEIQGMLPEVRISRSIFNKKQSGLSALYEAAGKAGMTCLPWQEPYREISSRKGLLLIVSPNATISEAEIEQILNWVKSGNELVYLDDFSFDRARRIFGPLGLHLKEVKEDQRNARGHRRHFLEFHLTPEGTHAVELHLSSKVRVKGGSAVIEDEQGAFLTEVTYGKGRILLGTVPAMCSNFQITDSKSWDNFQYLLNWFATANGDILFDERCHGFSSSINLFVFLMRGAPGRVVCQLLLILAVGIVSAHQRFGEIETYVQKRKSSNLEFIRGLANTYERVGGGLAALEIIMQDFRVWLCRLLNVSPHADNKDLIDALSMLEPAAAKALSALFQESDRLCEKKTISQYDLVKQVRTCDLLQEKIQSALAR